MISRHATIPYLLVLFVKTGEPTICKTFTLISTQCSLFVLLAELKNDSIQILKIQQQYSLPEMVHMLFCSAQRSLTDLTVSVFRETIAISDGAAEFYVVFCFLSVCMTVIKREVQRQQEMRERGSDMQ